MHRFLRLYGLTLLVCGLQLAPLAGMAQTATAATQAQPGASWQRLGDKEKLALAPLAERWGELSDNQRSKWRAIASNFDQLSPAERQVMQARMKEWVALSPAQRNQARLNFNSLQSVSKDQKKTRWDEYQALSEEEKRKLSAGALAPAKTAAPSPRPAAPERLVQPALRTVPAAALPPRAPIDQKTLLPVPAATTASSDSQPAASTTEPETAGRDASSAQ